jgi:hypothetical protein
MERGAPCIPTQSALQKLRDDAKKLADAGVTSLWLPPPSDAVSAQGYLPRSLVVPRICHEEPQLLEIKTTWFLCWAVASSRVYGHGHAVKERTGCVVL